MKQIVNPLVKYLESLHPLPLMVLHWKRQWYKLRHHPRLDWCLKRFFANSNPIVVHQSKRLPYHPDHHLCLYLVENQGQIDQIY